MYDAPILVSRAFFGSFVQIKRESSLSHSRIGFPKMRNAATYRRFCVTTPAFFSSSPSITNLSTDVPSTVSPMVKRSEK